MTEADSFMKDAEHKVVEMLHANQERFQQFREMQRRGVAWPHSAQLRCEIEAAGFVYRPMMIKRDRCVCDDCGIEVNGWKPWHNPLSFHNYEKHKVPSQAVILPYLIFFDVFQYRFNHHHNCFTPQMRQPYVK